MTSLPAGHHSLPSERAALLAVRSATTFGHANLAVHAGPRAGGDSLRPADGGAA